MKKNDLYIRGWTFILVFLIIIMGNTTGVLALESEYTQLTYNYNPEELAHIDDYMKALAKETSIRFEQVPMGNHADITWTIGNSWLNDNLSEHDIRSKSVEFQPLFFYSHKKYLGNQLFKKGQRIGIQSSDYLELNKDVVFENKDVEIYVYHQVEQMMKDYKSGQLDLFVSTNNNYTLIEDNQVVAYQVYVTYALHQSAYMILHEGSYDTLNRLNAGIERIQAQGDMPSIFVGYESAQEQENFYHLLTAEEMDYLTAKSKIYVYVPESIPYFYSNSSHYYGYVYETLRALEELLKTPIVFQTKIDAKTDMVWGDQVNTAFNIQTIPFMKENFVMVGLNQEPQLVSLDTVYNQRVGVYNSEEFSRPLIAELPGVDITYYDTSQSLVNGIYNHSIDIAMMSIWDMNYYDKALNKKELALRLITPFIESSSFFLKETNVQLAQVINKGIQVINMKKIEDRSLENVPKIVDRKQSMFVAIVILLAVIGIVVAIISIRTHINSRRNRELRYLYAHDYLTLLPNKNGITQHMSKQIKSNAFGSVVLLDVNGFKEINNRIGHKGGDALLVSIAQKFMGVINESRVLGRVGGDEFLLVMSHESKDGEKEVIKILRQCIQELKMENPQVHHFDMSMGIVRFPEHGRDYDSLYTKAKYVIDYINQYHIEPKGLHFTQKLYDVYIEEQELLSQIEKGIEQEEFELYIQPQIHLESQRIIGGEMLIRWNHPQKGLLPPAAFIDIAEKNGKIRFLDYYVLDKACQFMGKQQKDGNFFKVSVNMTTDTFTREEMLKYLLACILTYDVDPEYLIIEITEDMGFENLNKANDVFEQLKQLGVKVALDDFGKGYSSLSYLEKLNIDLLKIDKYFIDNIHLRDKSHHVFKVVYDLAKIMKIDIIAEGVECQEQVDILNQHPGIIVQGYYYSKPMTLSAFLKLYDKKSIVEFIDFS